MIDNSFKHLRKNFRHKGKFIIDYIKRNHFSPLQQIQEIEICSFCGISVDLTKEHVIPKWCFENNPEKNFETVINGSNQAYYKTSIPACSKCNNEILSEVEKYISNLFRKTDLKINYYEYEESINIIRWLELIDYKFQILNFRRKYLRHHSEKFIPFLRDIPLSIMRKNIGFSPYKAIGQLRNSQLRIKRAEKDSRYLSLVFWKSKNKNHHFFHTMDEYIFFEFPEFEMALFYFFNKEFKTNFEAEKEAKQIIMNNY